MEIYNKLFGILNPADVLLTANKRLIPFLHKAYARYQQTQKKQVWSTPLVFTLSGWLELLWEKQLIEHTNSCARLLNKQQAFVIWQTIISKSSYLLLDNTTHTAKIAQQAWQLLHQAQLDYKLPLFKQNSETATWQTWANTFAEFSKAYHYLDPCSATQTLIELFNKKILKPPKRIFLLGFTEINPQTKQLLNCLAQLDCKVCHYVAAYPEPQLQRLPLVDKQAEFSSMAQWAYQCWQAGKQSIGCVVPNLLEHRSCLVDNFTEIFAQLAPETFNSPLFNIAAGNAFKEFSLIQTALMIIELETVNSFSKTSNLIRSPYLGGSLHEQSQRAQLDIYLRCYAENSVSLDQVIAASKKLACQHLNHLIEKLCVLLKEVDTAFLATPSLWAAYFAKKLHALGWPGERCLTSTEFQLIERWSGCLKEFAELDFILGKITLATAVQQLRALVSSILFQAKTMNEPPIHVLGLLDSTGICFDALWVMGLDDRTWPALAQPNPFIPYSLQRQHKLPHASSERELYFASLLTQNLQCSAPQIIFSHPQQCLDHALRPSLLISDIKAIHIEALNLPFYQSSAEKIWSSQTWEYYSDDQGPAIEDHEIFSASSQLFQSQAACPFQAFARFRLAAHFYPFPQTGLNASDRGILIHQLLEQFWNAVGSQAALLQLSPLATTEIINSTIDSCLVTFSKKRPFILKPRFNKIERQRLQALLKNIIDLEKQRPPFFQSQHEQKKSYKLDKLALNLRIDRIDQLTDTNQLIIDYKTGVPVKINWLEERLDYPQLPLYCLAYPETVRGFAVMHIRSHGISLQGITANESEMHPLTPLKKLKTPLALQTWSDLLHHWQNLLERLAQQFQAGVAEVDPKHGQTTCRHCDLQLLCRIKHKA